VDHGALEAAERLDWSDTENVPARDWLIRSYGERTYRVLYAPLLEQKFRNDAPSISAAWMWARFHRLGNSRTPITMKERIGYWRAGARPTSTRWSGRCGRGGGRADLRAGRSRGRGEGSRARHRCDGTLVPFDAVISTVPIPHTGELFAGIEGSYFDNLRRLKYIGVMVMLLQLDRRFSKYYWMNVSDKRLPLSGIIEYTNLNPYPALNGDAILYIPQYLPHTHPLYGTPDEELFDLYCDALRTINLVSSAAGSGSTGSTATGGRSRSARSASRSTSRRSRRRYRTCC
jgi:protoporphyrinogen oxidase